MALLKQLSEAVINGQDDIAPQLVQQALDAGTSASDILAGGLLAGMEEVGRRFRTCEYFIPEVLVSAEAMKAAMEVLRPQLLSAGIKPAATAIIGTVKGDLHDIGKSIVATMLEGAGFEVIDLGVDVSAEKFIEACRKQPVQLVAVSALLTTTMGEMKQVVSRLREEVKPCPTVIVGGAPVTENYAREIGADGYGRDAASGAALAKQLCLGGK